jgi:hypothetical protein
MRKNKIKLRKQINKRDGRKGSKNERKMKDEEN